MIISTKGRYALRLMIDMAEHQTEGYIPLKEIAQRQEISEKYLESIKADMECANPWERVTKLVDMTAESEHDMSRMKQVMIRMKNDAGKN